MARLSLPVGSGASFGRIRLAKTGSPIRTLPARPRITSCAFVPTTPRACASPQAGADRVSVASATRTVKPDSNRRFIPESWWRTEVVSRSLITKIRELSPRTLLNWTKEEVEPDRLIVQIWLMSAARRRLRLLVHEIFVKLLTVRSFWRTIRNGVSEQCRLER